MKKEYKKKQNNKSPTEGVFGSSTSRSRTITNGECVFKKVECLSSKQGKITKQDKAQVVYELRLKFPVKALIKLAGIPRSTYYYWVNQFDRPDKDAELKTLIQVNIS